MSRVSLKKGLGDCFETSLQGILDGSVKLDNGATVKLDSDARLVHGVVWNNKERVWMTHGWIEPNPSTCLNTATGYARVTMRSLYYEAGRVKETIRYTRHEAMLQVLHTKHYGPWNITEPTTTKGEPQ